jgi:hypothetical protein
MAQDRPADAEGDGDQDDQRLDIAAQLGREQGVHDDHCDQQTPAQAGEILGLLPPGAGQRRAQAGITLQQVGKDFRFGPRARLAGRDQASSTSAVSSMMRRPSMRSIWVKLRVSVTRAATESGRRRRRACGCAGC